jgi:hypothetical protein
LAFLDHAFLSVYNIKFAPELFQMASSVDVLSNFPSILIFVCPTS